jgi:hypothetical protein
MGYVPPQSHVVPLCTVRRERFLPVSGEVLVKVNQHADAPEIVARAHVPTGHVIVDVGRYLGVPALQADRYVGRKKGDEVKRGTVLAERRTSLGLQSRVARSPAAGTIIATGEGRVIIETAHDTVELHAGIPGIVANVTPGLGVVMETSGALIQGVWGTGGQDFGVMQVLSDENDEPLPAEAITVSQRGMIVVGGRGVDGEGLRRAREFHVKGMILGSLRADLMKEVQSLGVPVLLVEGFGDRAMAAPAFTLLKTNGGREVAVDARPGDRLEGSRPEVVIPLPSSAHLPPLPVVGEELAPGKRVRALRAPYAGAVGTVARLLDDPALLPSGLRASAARVDLENAGPAIIPLANLEILG